MADSILVGKATLKEGVKVTCESAGHVFYTDEPKASGGTDEGMNPLQAFLCSLGACKSVIARMAGRKMRVQFEELEVECKGTIDFDGITGKNPNAKTGIKNIETTYTFKTSASKEEIEKLVDYVDIHCPVMDTVINSPTHSHKIVIR